jgi:hypothetical protein
MTQDAQQAREQQQDVKIARTAMRAGNGAPSAAEQASLLHEVTQTDAEAGTAEQLANLLAKDLPLANFDEEHITEHRWWLEAVLERYQAMHPPSDSAMTGAARAWGADDADAWLEPLGEANLMRDEGGIKVAFSRVTRGEDMAQQETSAKSINENTVHRDDRSTSGGGLLGRFKG